MERRSEWAGEQNRVLSVTSEGVTLSRPGVPKILLRSDVEMRRERLSRVIAREIIPRLNTFHHGLRGEAAAATVPGASEIAEFGELVMRTDLAAASHFFDKMIAEGYSLDTLFIHLLQPTARYLGELWEQDRCDFVDVTIGVAHLQTLLSVFASKDDIPVRDADHRALLITTPGERHIFGLDMVAKFMRGAGWEVPHNFDLSLTDCADAVAREWFGVAGLTLSSDANIPAAASVIETVRRASANRSLPIMVGGPVFARNPELVLRLGADAAAPDAPTAVILAKKLLLSFNVKRPASNPTLRSEARRDRSVGEATRKSRFESAS
jgi:MerR family transcriptional regulator, light-induced transcriptional regulator